jgi:hypothetical protein
MPDLHDDFLYTGKDKTNVMQLSCNVKIIYKFYYNKNAFI